MHCFHSDGTGQSPKLKFKVFSWDDWVSGGPWRDPDCLAMLCSFNNDGQISTNHCNSALGRNDNVMVRLVA